MGKSVQMLENVRGRDVFVIQTIALDPNNYLMELLIIIDALKRASARSIVAVIPYYGYCRQDRKDKPRVPITAKLVANLLSMLAPLVFLPWICMQDKCKDFLISPLIICMPGRF